jgi:hypothetical protein
MRGIGKDPVFANSVFLTSAGAAVLIGGFLSELRE